MAKIQWNTMSKELKDAVEEFSKNYYKFVALLSAHNADVKRCNANIQAHQADADKDGWDEATKQAKLDRVAADITELEEVNRAYEEAKKAIPALEATATAYITEDLYKAYCNRKDAQAEYNKAIRNWCESINVKPTDGGISYLTMLVGDRFTKSGKAARENHGIASLSYKQFACIWFANISIASGLTKQLEANNKGSFALDK